MNTWSIEPLKIEDVEGAYELIKRVFEGFIASDYSEEGVRTFMEYIHPTQLMKRVQEGNPVYLAKHQEVIIAVIETRNENHISLLFVAKEHQKKGIATALFQTAFPQDIEVSVNASPYAVTIYERLGFHKVSGELIKNGITYIPMLREVH